MKTRTIILISIFIFLVLTGCSKTSDDGIGISESNKLYQEFIGDEENKDVKIIKCGESDITEDEIEDLLIIYEKDDRVRLISYLSVGDSFVKTNPIPAPVENQSIQFKNIDKKGKMEFIISGSKNGLIGYGVYRVQENELIDLFSQDMEDCCN